MPANRVLPDARTLVKLYTVEHLSFAEIGRRYGVGPSAVRQTMTRDARRNGTQWPLKRGTPGWRRRKAEAVGRVTHDSVTAIMIRAEINECRATYGVTLREIAALSGVNYWTVAKLSGGSRKRLARATAQKIEMAIRDIEKRARISEGVRRSRGAA